MARRLAPTSRSAGRDPAPPPKLSRAASDKRIAELVRGGHDVQVIDTPAGEIVVRVEHAAPPGPPPPPSIGERIATYAISAVVGIAVTYVAARILQGVLPPQAPTLFTPPNLGAFARVSPPPSSTPEQGQPDRIEP